MICIWMATKNVVTIILWILSEVQSNPLFSGLLAGFSGCVDGTMEGLQDGPHPKVAAYEGAWPYVITTLYLNGHYKCGHYIQSTLSNPLFPGLFAGFSGCVDGTTEGLQDGRHPKVAACEGAWSGHVENASSLCRPGWRVCSWDDNLLLRAISWKDATSLSGCYAINAAQDGGQCKPCKANLEAVSLANLSTL